MNANSESENLLELTGGVPPERILSLVPSMTESMIDLGLGGYLCGVTDYCVLPNDLETRLMRVGGPKNPDIDTILHLQPDLILANQEENSKRSIEQLVNNGLIVWVSFPQTVYQALDVLWKIVQVFPKDESVSRLRTLNTAVDWACKVIPDQPLRYFCPIWQDQTGAGTRLWMTFNRDTYAYDLLRICGGENAFSERQRGYPLNADLGSGNLEDPAGRDTRYPRVTLDEVILANPEVVILPSEPYLFTEHDRKEILGLLADTPAGKNGRIYLVDGSLITWHGTRISKALQELPFFFA